MAIITGWANQMRQKTTVSALAVMPLTSRGPKPHAVTATTTAGTAIPARRSGVRDIHAEPRERQRLDAPVAVDLLVALDVVPEPVHVAAVRGRDPILHRP